MEPENSTLGQADGSHHDTNQSAPAQTFRMHLAMYIGISIGLGIVICLIIIVVIVLYKRGKFARITNRRSSSRRLFIRGFSTITQRGVIDSTAEFEMINTSVTASVSSDDGRVSKTNSSIAKNTPKKPERRRTRTSSSTVKYENVTLDSNAGFVVRKSASMNSEIPYIDNTLDSRVVPPKEEDELDDVFD